MSDSSPVEKSRRVGIVSTHGAAIERLEGRRLLSVTPTFAAAKVVPYAVPGTVTNYTYGRFNGDSALDLAVSSFVQNADLTITYRRDDATSLNNGAFVQKAIFTGHSGFGSGFQVGDFNGDGKADLFAQSTEAPIGGGPSRYLVYVYPGDGTGAFAAGAKGNGGRYDGTRNTNYTIADVTGDGRSDIIFAGDIGVQVVSDLDGSGNFDTAYSSNGISGVLPVINAVDVTKDGKRDLIFGVETPTRELLYVTPKAASGFGAAIPAAQLAGRPVQQRFGDFNGDGKIDIAVLERDRSDVRENANTAAVEVLLGDGAGRFFNASTTRLNGNPGGLTAADFDGDGQVDIVAGLNGRAGGTPSSAVFLGNTGNGTFAATGIAGFNNAVSSLDSGDFNGDGKPDLIGVDRVTRQLFLVLNNSLKPAVVVGSVYNDVNGDGRYQAGEPNLAGRTVWADDNFNNILDSGEAYTTTDANGNYRLAFRKNTQIREVLPAGWSETPGYSGARSPGRALTYVAGVTSSVTFSQRYRGTISGRVFADTNANRTYDFNVVIGDYTAFESGIAGRTVFLDKNNNGKIDPGEPTTTSDADGVYGFDVAPGTYTVRDVPVTGELNTTGTSFSVTFASGSARYDVNFGHTKPGGISGVVYYDAGQFGTYIDGDALLPGVRVFIDTNLDGNYQSGEPTAVTDAKGFYSIQNQFPGNVRVRLVKPASSYLITAPTAGFYNTRIVGGYAGGGSAFGLINPAFVTGTVFADNDANGQIASYEKGVAGFVVFIDYNTNGTPDQGEPITLSDASGNYKLTSSRAGSFKVVLRKLSGYTSTAPSSSARTVNFVQGLTVAGQHFGVIKGAFSTAPYKPPVNIPATSNPTSVATGDFNKDGKADFIVAGNNSLGQVFFGNGNGSFTHNASKDFVIGGATRYMIAVDVSGDGKIDLIAADQDDDTGTGVFGGVAVLLGNGDGTFKPAISYSAGSGTYGVAVADFNKDGKPDIVAANRAGSVASVLMNKGGGTFNAPRQITVPFGATGVAVGDVNNDGKADFVLASPDDSSIIVVTGKGDGTFNAASRQTAGANRPNFISIADLNADGKQDLVFANPDANGIVVRLGNGNATFGSPTAYATADFPQQVAVIDVDKDGILDLIASCRSDGTADISGGVSILRGRGDGTFSDQKIATAHTSPTAVAVADFNGDGKLDLIAANFFSDDVSVLINNT